MNSVDSDVNSLACCSSLAFNSFMHVCKTSIIWENDDFIVVEDVVSMKERINSLLIEELKSSLTLKALNEEALKKWASKSSKHSSIARLNMR